MAYETETGNQPRIRHRVQRHRLGSVDLEGFA